MIAPYPRHLFEACGIELEYMIVDADSLSVRPIADELLYQVAGAYEMEVELGDMAWSNELALHVIELKTLAPRPSLGGLGAIFQEHVGRINQILAPTNARLLPTGMHPWMDPEAELRLWPHENNPIYETFDRIFGCTGHGWANLQSTHVNLPFADDAEFGRLHAAIRLVLPLLPGLAASTPFMDGRPGENLDSRLEAYRHNARRVASVAGHVIPERVFTRREYEEGLLRRIYDDLAPLDPQGIVRYEWVNARGCIARFDRSTIEIRVLDVQECPAADIAVAACAIAVVRALVEEAWADTNRQRSWDERELAEVFLDAMRDGDQAVIANRRFLETFGFPERGRARLRDVWQHLVETLVARDPLYAEWEPAIEVILSEGCLARRIARTAGEAPSRDRLHQVYGRLATCLANGRLFRTEG